MFATDVEPQPNKPAGANAYCARQFRFAVHGGWCGVAHHGTLGILAVLLFDMFKAREHR